MGRRFVHSVGAGYDPRRPEPPGIIVSGGDLAAPDALRALVYGMIR